MTVGPPTWPRWLFLWRLAVTSDDSGNFELRTGLPLGDLIVEHADYDPLVLLKGAGTENGAAVLAPWPLQST